MGIPTLIKTLTASGDSSLSFVDGTADVTLDSTYDEYMFVYTGVNPATDNVHFQFQVSTDGGSSYGVSMTTTFFDAWHNEGDTGAGMSYETSKDLANGTGYQTLNADVGNDADFGCVGILHLFNPSSTTYVKHFYNRATSTTYSNYAHDDSCAGYVNTTSAVDAINFKCSSGNFDGVIQLYGIS